MNENELMSSLPVPKAVAKMAIPSVISSLVTVVYNMADTFFIGQTSFHQGCSVLSNWRYCDRKL